MLIKNETLYTLNDVVVIPKEVSDVFSRSECNPTYDSTKMLPLFASPMTNILNDNNLQPFLNAGVNVVVPRDDERLSYDERKLRWENLWKKDIFVAMSLREFIQYFITDSPLDSAEDTSENKHNDSSVFDTSYVRKVCVDLANGHMKQLINVCARVKANYGDKVIIMTGNIANPDTYLDYAIAGIDYVRCGIGVGSACTTSANSSIHYPIASLIEKCKEYKNTVEVAIEQKKEFGYKTPYISAPKIVADGGFGNFDQIIKALALGADYCMCGKLFAQCIESCMSIVSDKDFTWPHEKDEKYPSWHSTVRNPYEHVDFVLELMERGHNFTRDYYGMSTKRAQVEMGGKGNKTAEGIGMKVPVKYTVAGWVDNFKSYLKSAMSYTGFKRLEDFIGGPEMRLMSSNSYIAYFK